MARSTKRMCRDCGFFLPLSGSLGAMFGVCGNELSADGHVVDKQYGCGAHSDTPAPAGGGSPMYEPYDDGVLDVTDRPAESAAETPEAAPEGQPESESQASPPEPPEPTEPPEADRAAGAPGRLLRAPARGAGVPARADGAVGLVFLGGGFDVCKRRVHALEQFAFEVRRPTEERVHRQIAKRR